MSATGRIRRVKKTHTIKGDELKALQRIVGNQMERVKGNMMPSDSVGFRIMDYKVAKITITLDHTIPVPKAEVAIKS